MLETHQKLLYQATGSFPRALIQQGLHGRSQWLQPREESPARSGGFQTKQQTEQIPFEVLQALDKVPGKMNSKAPAEMLLS